jgi:hypothetical protein
MGTVETNPRFDRLVKKAMEDTQQKTSKTSNGA